MELKITSISIDIQALLPSLLIGVELEFGSNVEAPVFISGRLSGIDGKVLSLLSEYQVNTDYSYGLHILSEADKNRIYREKRTNSYYAQLIATLSPKAIEHIELLREKDNEKSIRFNLDFVIKYLELPAGPENLAGDSLVRLQIRRKYSQYIIKQSDWVNNYSPHLGIGNFMILELQIPDDKKVSEFWKKLYGLLCSNLKDMEASLRHGDWQKTMFFARKFYENAKIGDSKKAHAKFKEEFNKLMMKDQHPQQGIDDLHVAIWKLFEFISKYSHDKDKDGNLNLLPITTKEDAYFAYAIALGLLNLIGRKVNIE